MINPFTKVNWSPGVKEKRSFARSLMIGFPCIALVFTLAAIITHHAPKPGLCWMAGIGFVLGLIFWLVPAIAKPFYVTWYFVACCIGIVMSNLLFSLFFYLVFTPIGLLVRGRTRFGKNRSLNRASATYWKDVEKSADMGRYFRQF